MLAFIFYTVLMIVIGIIVRLFWVPILIIGSILIIILGIIVSSAVTAFVFEMFNALFTNGQWDGFKTYFAYSLVFFTVSTVVYMAIVKDIFKILYKLLKN